MSLRRRNEFAEIEAELEKMPPDQLRSLALKSWAAYVEKEGHAESFNICDKNDPLILAALDQATQRGTYLRTRVIPGPKFVPA